MYCLVFLSSPRYYIQDTADVPFSACYICLARFIMLRVDRRVSVIPV
jgi:hypothetical protein